jgi:hypothetical protein
MQKLFGGKLHVNSIAPLTARLLYFLASVLFIVAALCLVLKAFHEIYFFVIVRGQIDKDLLDAISYAIIAIAVADVGRYLFEEEVQRDKQSHSPGEARQTFTRFMVVIAIAVALEGLVGIFEAANKDFTLVLWPLALILASVFIMVGLGVFLRLVTDPVTSAPNSDMEATEKGVSQE